MSCPTCKVHRLVVIDMRVAGQSVRMASCSSCDSRWWEGANGALPLDHVLSLASPRR